MFLEIEGKPWIPLELGHLYLLGREISADKEKSNYFIELEEEEDVSQRHCVIETNQDAEVFVFDLFSLKGTLLNNKILKSLEKTRLCNGDVLRCGKNQIKYVHDDNEVDSSGFLEVNKSGAMSSNSDSKSHIENSTNFLVPSVPLKRLDTSTSSSTTNNRRSDSFIIPETQYCRSRDSIGSNLSVAESVLDNNDGKIAFNFGNLDSFEGEEDICIPETQELMDAPDASISESRRNSTVQEMSSKECTDGSQFRICTQDYNEGFGEEESVAQLNSQIIPLIRHQTVDLNNTKRSNENSFNGSSLINENIGMSALKASYLKSDQEATVSRSDCPTPDIFDFEGCNENNQLSTKDIDGTATEQYVNFLDDKEDLLPTQVLPIVPVNAKVVKNNKLNELDKPCFEIENDHVITLSDKENRCPVRLEPMADLPPTQLFEASAARTNASISYTNPGTAIKTNLASSIGNKSNSLLNIIADEDDLLTQVLLQPISSPINSCNSPSKSLLDKYSNSTLIDEKNPAAFFADIEKTSLHQAPSPTLFKIPEKDLMKKTTSGTCSTSENDLDLLIITPQVIKDNFLLGRAEEKTPLKQAPSAHTLFKMPEKDLGMLKKTSSSTSSTSENDLDLLMCTPQLIKDNLFLGRTEDMKKNILAVQNRNLFGDDSDNEDNNNDDQSELVKLINVPKTSSDFEKLLPHLNKKPEITKINEEEIVPKEAQKRYKFSISFGKEMDEKASTSKSSAVNPANKSVQRRENKKIKNERDSKRGQIEKASITPARRITRSKSKVIDISPVGEKDDLDSIETQPIVKATRSRSKSDKKESQASHKSNTSHKNSSYDKKDKTRDVSSDSSKRYERKRKADPQPTEPLKAERKRLRSTDSLTSSSVAISMTMVDQELFKNLFKNSKGVWSIAKNCADSDVLVMDKPYRTFKFLLSVARGIPIVTSEFLKKLNEVKSAKGVRTSDYLFINKEFEKKYNFSLVNSLQAAGKTKVLKGYEFLMTASILPTPQEIKTIIETAGGYVHDKTPPKPKENQELYLVTTKEDKKEWHKYRRINKNINIVSTEAIMSTIMSQKIQMNNYRLT